MSWSAWVARPACCAQAELQDLQELLRGADSDEELRRLAESERRQLIEKVVIPSLCETVPAGLVLIKQVWLAVAYDPHPRAPDPPCSC